VIEYISEWLGICLVLSLKTNSSIDIILKSALVNSFLIILSSYPAALQLCW